MFDLDDDEVIFGMTIATICFVVGAIIILITVIG